MGVGVTDFERLTNLYPEQMRRDPSGRLAELTDAAVKSSVGVAEQVQYVHAGKCGGGVASAGITPSGASLLVAPKTGFEPLPEGTAARLSTGVLAGIPDDLPVTSTTSDGVTTISFGLAPPGAKPARKGKGWKYPDGMFALIVEPTTLLEGPSHFQVRCSRCGCDGTLARSTIAQDLHRHRGPRHRIPVVLSTSI